MRTYGLSIGLNAVLLLQIVVYRANTETFFEGVKGEEERLGMDG